MCVRVSGCVCGTCVPRSRLCMSRCVCVRTCVCVRARVHGCVRVHVYNRKRCEFRDLAHTRGPATCAHRVRKGEQWSLFNLRRKQNLKREKKLRLKSDHSSILEKNHARQLNYHQYCVCVCVCVCVCMCACVRACNFVSNVGQILYNKWVSSINWSLFFWIISTQRSSNTL